MATNPVAIKEFTLTTVIRNVSQMKLNGVYFTQSVAQFNVPWKIAYVQEATHFSLYVHCEKEQGKEYWSISTQIRASLNSSDGKYMFKRFPAIFGNRTRYPGYGITDFIPMEELRQKLLINDEVVLEVKIEILEMTGIDMPRMKSFDDDEAKSMSDVTLLVEEKRFYVLDYILARQSTYFNTLFFENPKESKQSEITLNGIDSNIFQVYLEILHMQPACTDSCVEDVLELSQKYDSYEITRVCETFLITKSNLSTKKKLQIGIRFALKDLKTSCLNSMKTAADVRAVMDCGGLENGIKDPEVLRSLIDKSLYFMSLN